MRRATAVSGACRDRMASLPGPGRDGAAAAAADHEPRMPARVSMKTMSERAAGRIRRIAPLGAISAPAPGRRSFLVAIALGSVREGGVFVHHRLARRGARRPLGVAAADRRRVSARAFRARGRRAGGGGGPGLSPRGDLRLVRPAGRRRTDGRFWRARASGSGRREAWSMRGCSSSRWTALRLSFPFGARSILWLFATVWATDCFAYFGGRLIGGPKLWPRISPSKNLVGDDHRRAGRRPGRFAGRPASTCRSHGRSARS